MFSRTCQTTCFPYTPSNPTPSPHPLGKHPGLRPQPYHTSPTSYFSVRLEPHSSQGLHRFLFPPAQMRLIRAHGKLINFDPPPLPLRGQTNQSQPPSLDRVKHTFSRFPGPSVSAACTGPVSRFRHFLTPIPGIFSGPQAVWTSTERFLISEM